MSTSTTLKIILTAFLIIGSHHQLAQAQETTMPASTPSAAPSEPAVDPAPVESGFSKLTLGMTIKQVYKLIGTPDDSDSHESGKRWIPFYFGNDARRLEALYKNEGCLVFASGNLFGGDTEGELKEIIVDTSGACFKQQ